MSLAVAGHEQLAAASSCGRAIAQDGAFPVQKLRRGAPVSPE